MQAGCPRLCDSRSLRAFLILLRRLFRFSEYKAKESLYVCGIHSVRCDAYVGHASTMFAFMHRAILMGAGDVRGNVARCGRPAALSGDRRTLIGELARSLPQPIQRAERIAGAPAWWSPLRFPPIEDLPRPGVPRLVSRKSRMYPDGDVYLTKVAVAASNAEATVGTGEVSQPEP